MSARKRILVVDDELAVRVPIRRFLASNGFDVEEADGVRAALEASRHAPPDLAIVDYSLGDGDGLELLRGLKAADPGLPVIVLTGHGTIDLAVRAMQDGAEQFFTKPVELPTLLVVLQRALENRRNRQTSLLGRSRSVRAAVDPFLGGSPGIRRLREEATRIARASIPVLIQGETGSGKGVLATWIHEAGPRGEEPFVDLNCAGVSRELLESELFGYEKGAFTGAVAAKPGLLELAHGGTFFLDEIGDIELAVQAKLLKVIEELRFRRLGDVRDRRVDVRLIAATHRDLARQVQEQRFREDLLYRINAVTLVVPPLRERGEDAVLIAKSLLARIGSELDRPAVVLSEAAERAIARHPWPGNVRQLRNALERAVLLTDRATLQPGDVLPDAEPASGRGVTVATRGVSASAASAAGPAAAEPLTLDEIEKRHIEDMLRRAEGSVPQTARLLGLSRSALYARMKRHHIVVRRSV